MLTFYVELLKESLSNKCMLFKKKYSQVLGYADSALLFVKLILYLHRWWSRECCIDMSHLICNGNCSSILSSSDRIYY